MKLIRYLSILIVSSTIINVWLFRYDKDSIYRGGDATNMLEEFYVYGLNETFLYVVGTIKVFSALILLIGIFYDKLIFFSAFLISGFMTAAIFMHLKVGDELIKSLPASIILLLSLVIVYSTYFKQKRFTQNF
tara:strand:- start:398 stop:796 length:399 start_codon:yes stop_codon:yes gene_type:complete